MAGPHVRIAGMGDSKFSDEWSRCIAYRLGQARCICGFMSDSSAWHAQTRRDRARAGYL